jgi:hypothetical protein
MLLKAALLKRSIEGAKTALDPNEADLRIRNKDMDQFCAMPAFGLATGCSGNRPCHEPKCVFIAL